MVNSAWLLNDREKAPCQMTRPTGTYANRKCEQVSELDLSKTKATELLRTYDGALDAVVKSYVVPGVKV